ncbi:hypothetical protein BG011_008241 [Mortierella polycephala]|uniref:Uncharacterized protein n=1 Tax=Mortierella polycephala TaxID=41804 RepID=A0A9P6PRG7_9FUNG|nr:hypothetical protein BG011_008241 [Mortierella polycephala]
MAVAMLPKKKLKSRSRQRSPSSRAFEEEDEDMAIINRLEREPWQPDLLLERQSDKSPDQRYVAHETQSAMSSTYGKNNAATTDTAASKDTTPRFQIPVIIKSPSSVITTADDSDCVESIFEDHSPKVPGIEKYLEQTHQEQQLMQQQQQEMQLQLQLQYQLPAHLQNRNHSNNNNNSRRQQQEQGQGQHQYRNSFHGESAPFSNEDALTPRPSSTYETRTRSETPQDKTIVDGKDVVDSLQSLKNLAMLALDGLLQQVVSHVTASDPVYNPDKTTLQARVMIRRKSFPLLNEVQDVSQDEGQDLESNASNSNQLHNAVSTPAPARTYISDTLIASVATSSLERLDELARKVDQLAVVATDEQIAQQQQLQQNHSSTLRAPFDTSVNQQALTSNGCNLVQQQQQQQQPQVNPSQIFESQEYQLACALAALLACIYRILNQMQESRLPQRTESADSGLDQAARLWKRLSSNSFSRGTPLKSPARSLESRQRNHVKTGSLSLSSSPENNASAYEDAISSNGTTGLMQSFNKQVRTLRSRRTQSTSHIEVPNRSLRPGRLLSGLGLSSKVPSPEIVAQSEKAHDLDQDWAELDKLMDEMSDLWQFVESLESDDGEASGEREDASDDNPFHDRHQLQQQVTTSSTANIPYNFDQQTLDMTAGEDLPQYVDDDVPQYKSSEKTDSTLAPLDNHRPHNPIRRGSRNGLASTVSGLDDEKTRFDLNNVMSAIERLSKVAPRLDDQRVQLSPSQKKQMTRANVAHTIDRLSRRLRENQITESQPSSASTTERNRDLNKLVNQIVESAKAGYMTQRAEFSPRQQWKLEGARISDKIERGERMRMSDQDWQSPESVLLKDMTRLTNALYQQSASSKAYATQRYTLTEDKARNMALQGIISKIERVSGRRMDNQDALPRSSRSKSTSMAEKHDQDSSRAKELQDMMNRMAESGGGPTRKSAMASQRAEFSPR